MNRPYTLTVGLLTLTVVSGGVLASSYASADDVVDDISITVPTSCTMSGVGMNSHSAEIANGTYTPSIGSTTIKTLCNDNAGFSIYATGFTGETIGQTNSNKLVGTSASSNATIDTGTATGPVSNNDTSNWAMKLTPVTSPTPTYPIIIKGSSSDTERQSGDTDYSTYSAVPNEYTKVATRLQGTDVGTNAEGSSLTTTYAAYISKTQPADTYSGKVKYTLVHPNTAEPTPPSVSFDNAYAAAGKTKLNNYYKMQDMSSSICSAVTLEDDASETTLIDSRDNKTYKVSKLRDGNCWMTQNLDHDIVTDGTVVYNSETTDLPSNTTWIPSSATHATGDTDWDSTTTEPDSYDPGTLYWNGDLWPQNRTSCEATGGTWDGSWCDGSDLTSSTGNPHFHLGNYYNWTAALATNDSTDYGDDGWDEEGMNVNQSICPAGWTLPKGGDRNNNSFAPLLEQYGWDVDVIMDPHIWDSPIAIPLGGEYWGTLSSVGWSGNYWSSTVYGGGGAYGLYPGMYGEVLAYQDYERQTGQSVRCMAR